MNTPKMLRSLWTAPTRWRWQGSEELAALGLHRIVKFYGEVTVHTDELGKMWLEALHLPCAGNIKITLLLEDLRNHDPYNWSLGKLYTNMNQEEPFIQTDFDVIIGRQLPERIHRAGVCAERLYSNKPKREKEEDSWIEWFRKCDAPEHWKKDAEENNGIAFNCGMFGGNYVSSIQKISAASFEFSVRNAAKLRKIRADKGAIVCEEWAIAREYDPWEVSCLASMDSAGSELMAHTRGYCHQAGASKIEPEIMQKVRDRLEAEIPGQARRCKEVASAFANLRK